MKNVEYKYVSLDSLAAELCLPKAYLKQLLTKDTIPALNVNGRLRFNIVAVQKALDALAQQGGKGNE